MLEGAEIWGAVCFCSKTWALGSDKEWDRRAFLAATLAVQESLVGAPPASF